MSACFCGDDRCDTTRSYQESDAIDYYDAQTENTPAEPAPVIGQLELLALLRGPRPDGGI